MSDLPGAAAALAATPGAQLASARVAAGLSIAQIAEQMHISVRQVEAIEADRYEELPGAVFVRGFVRNYARLLKLDPVPLLRGLEPALGGDAPLRAHEIAGTLPESSRRGHGWMWVGLIALVLAVIAIAAAYERWLGRAPASASDSPPAGLAEPFTAPPIAAPEPPAPEQSSAAVPFERSADATVAPAEQAPQPAQAPVIDAAPPAEIAANNATVDAGVRLEIVFAAEAWIEVRDADGKVRFSGTVPAGSTRRFESRLPLDVVVGNASGVRITYNGRPFDLAPHATRNIARFRLE